MGTRGPKPTPTSVLKKRGSRLASSRTDEPQPELMAPPCPHWLSDDEKEVWHELVPQLEAMGVLTRIDAKSFERYCVTWVRWKGAVLHLKKFGEFTVHKPLNGPPAMKLSPMIAIVNETSAQLLRLEQEFGMTPSSRSRVSVVPIELKPGTLVGEPSLKDILGFEL